MPANKTYVVGLTGGIGCGKSEAARFLAELGACHIDADAISRSLTAPGGAAIEEIRRVFGESIFNDRGELDRRQLADIVFSDAAAKRALEGIIHPLVQRETMDRIEQAGRDGVRITILDVPLLFESAMDVLCDETWTMSADEETQIRRVCERDSLTEEQARARIGGQMDMDSRNERADRVIRSDRPIEKTRTELENLYQQLLKRI